MQETFHGFDQPDVWVEVEGTEYHGEIRATAWDEDSGTNEDSPWWAMCNVHYGPGDTRIEWHPATRVRRVADLDDEAGRVFSRPAVVPDLEPRG